MVEKQVLLVKTVCQNKTLSKRDLLTEGKLARFGHKRKTMQCSICTMETSANNLRLGVCWDCAQAESIIAEGLDMDDKSLTGNPALSPREKVLLLLARGWHHNGLKPDVPDEKPSPTKISFSVREILSGFAGLFSAFRR